VFQPPNNICDCISVKSDLTGDRDLIESSLIIKDCQNSKLGWRDIEFGALLEKHAYVYLVQSSNEKSGSPPQIIEALSVGLFLVTHERVLSMKGFTGAASQLCGRQTLVGNMRFLLAAGALLISTLRAVNNQLVTSYRLAQAIL